MSGALMVLIGDSLSAIVAKGEVTPRYYNPGDVFDEVHLVLTNDDRPDLDGVRPMVGRARLQIHNLPQGRMYSVRTAGWREPFVRPLLDAGARLAAQVRPDLVRVHNNFLEGLVAREIKRTLGVPYVVSLHGVWDRDDLGTAKQRVLRRMRRHVERAVLQDAGVVIAVYSPIMRYAREHGAKDVQLIHNVVAGERIMVKDDYRLHSPPRLVTVNRQVPEKNPEQIIRAVARLDCTYDVIGMGPLQDRLRAVAEESGCADRVRFIASVPNEDLCARLRDYDAMVTHCDYWGISKTVIEAGLAGLPIIANMPQGGALEEYEGGWVLQCPNTPEGYRHAISALLQDDERRQRHGRRAREVATARFDPEVLESRVADVYRTVRR